MGGGKLYEKISLDNMSLDLKKSKAMFPDDFMLKREKN